MKEMKDVSHRSMFKIIYVETRAVARMARETSASDVVAGLMSLAVQVEEKYIAPKLDVMLHVGIASLNC
jgi:hypothetical protein